MDIDIKAIEDRIKEKNKLEDEEFIKRLEKQGKQYRKEKDIVSSLMTKLAEKNEKKAKEAMEKQIADKEEEIRESVQSKYAKQYGSKEWNSTNNHETLLKSMLKNL